MELALLAGLGGVPLVTALTKIVGDSINIGRFAPAIAVLVGCAWNLGVAQVSGTGQNEALLIGIITGAVASGYYDVKKAVSK